MRDENIVSVAMSNEAKRLLDEIVASFDMKQKAALGRILSWFTQQDPMVQALVLGHIPEDYVADVVELMYRRLHRRKREDEG